MFVIACQRQPDFESEIVGFYLLICAKEMLSIECQNRGGLFYSRN